MFVRFVFPLVLIAIVGARGYSFRITKLIVPDTIPPDVRKVEIECSYDFINFTVVRWYKGGVKEFFRYKPREVEDKRFIKVYIRFKRFITFPTVGIGRVEVIHCGPTTCRLRLSDLTENATGLYRCKVDCEIAPYHYDESSFYMQVLSPQKQPLLEGLAEEFSDGQEMYANCSDVPSSSKRWYVNGLEDKKIRGSPTLKRNASRLIFSGVPPVVTVLCAEYRYGNLISSKKMQAKWKADDTEDDLLQKKAPNQWVGIMRSLPFGGQYAGLLKKIRIIMSMK